MPSFGLAHPRARFRFDRLTTAALARIARFPSYRAPRAADLHDPTTFRPPTRPYDTEDLSGRAFLANGTTHPTVRLVAVQPFMGELAACPHLATLRRLDLTGNRVGPDGVRALAASPFLGALRELGLNGNDLGADGAAALAAAPWVGGLTRLEVADNGLSADDVARVLDAAPRLEAVDVSGNAADVGALLRGGLRCVFAARMTGRLEVGIAGQPNPPDPPSLGGKGGDAPTDGHASVVRDPAPGDFNGSCPSPLRGGAGSAEGGTRGEVLPANPSAAVLETLDLRHNRIDLHALLALGPFPALARLDLGFNDLGDAALTDLPALRSLGLRANRLVAPTLAHPAVEDLDLSVNPLADHAAVVAGFPSLVRLDLGNTALTDAGLHRLLHTLPPHLRSLSLAWNPIGDAAAVALAEAPDLPALESLDLTGTRVTRRGLRALAARFGTIPA